MNFAWKILINLFFIVVFLFNPGHAQNKTKIKTNNSQFQAPIPGNTRATVPIALLPKDNGKTRFYFENGMFRERTHDNGDNLWRTSLAYIAYDDSVLLAGMLACTKWIGKNKVRYYRSFENDDESVSRDQVTMFLVAMAEGGKDVKKHVKATPWRLSKKYTLTPDMWLWMRALGGSHVARSLFYTIEIPIVKFYQLWNKRKSTKGRFPSYGLHLLAWQVYALKQNSNLDHTLRSIILKMTPEDNLLIRLLMCECVSQSDIDAVVPKTDFQWQRDAYTKAEVRPLTKEEAEYNTLDVDILQTMFNKAKQGK